MHTSARSVWGRGKSVGVGLLGTLMVGASWLLGMFAEVRGCCARAAGLGGGKPGLGRAPCRYVAFLQWESTQIRR